MCVQGCQAPDIQFCSGESELHAGRQQILAFAVHPDQQQEDHAADALDECAGNTDHQQALVQGCNGQSAQQASVSIGAGTAEDGHAAQNGCQHNIHAKATASLNADCGNIDHTEPALRTNLESLKNIKVRNGNEMAPISQFVSIKKVYGPDIISRFNMYTSIKVMVAPADGYTSGQALKAIEEVAGTTLPTGFGYELGGMAREEAETSGSTTGLIFLLCFVFVYLLLSAQYESYILPLAVLLSIPFGLMGSFLFVQGWAALGNIPALKMILGTMSNNIYMQIALIMLVGLLAKNAILIVEFALDRRRMGMSITWAAVLGAAARLRPILMTSLAMVVGLLPMMFAFGVGAHGNRTLGTAAIGGMFIGMIFQIFIVPVLFVVFQYLQEKFKPIEWEDLDNSDMNTEIEQYAKTK